MREKQISKRQTHNIAPSPHFKDTLGKKDGKSAVKEKIEDTRKGFLSSFIERQDKPVEINYEEELCCKKC